jgi:peptide/nickel transport system substrate-binding protein
MNVYIYPAEYYQEMGDDGFAQEPIGTGPFMFKDWDRGVAITLEKNPDYWNGVPKLDYVIFKPFMDAQTKLAALLAEEIDLALEVPPDDIATIEANDLTVEWALKERAMNLSFRPNRQGEALPTDDVRVRRALNYAIDKQGIVDNLMLGYAEPLKAQVLGPACYGHNPDLEPYPYDPEKAKELLAEAGYPDGFSLKLLGPTHGYSKVVEIVEAVAGQLTEVGIDVDLEIVDRAKFGETLMGPEAPPLAIGGINCFPAMDGDIPLQFYVSSASSPLYSTEKIDEIFLESRAAFDPAERLQVLQKLVAEMREYPTTIYLHNEPVIYGVGPRVKNFEATGDAVAHLLDVDVAE